jgi:hypothetical protein
MLRPELDRLSTCNRSALKAWINKILLYIRCPAPSLNKQNTVANEMSAPSNINWGRSTGKSQQNRADYEVLHQLLRMISQEKHLYIEMSLDTDHYCVLQIIKWPSVVKLTSFSCMSRHFRSKDNFHFGGNFVRN